MEIVVRNSQEETTQTTVREATTTAREATTPFIFPPDAETTCSSSTSNAPAQIIGQRLRISTSRLGTQEIAAALRSVFGLSDASQCVYVTPLAQVTTPARTTTASTTPYTSRLCSAPTIVIVSGTTISTNVGAATYANSQSCSWTITAPAGQVPVITFNTFSTEANYDFFNIYNGATTSSTALLRASGGSLPASVRASSGTVLVTFTSDNSVVSTGVTATVTFVTNIGTCYEMTGSGVPAVQVMIQIHIQPVIRTIVFSYFRVCFKRHTCQCVLRSIFLS